MNGPGHRPINRLFHLRKDREKKIMDFGWEESEIKKMWRIHKMYTLSDNRPPSFSINSWYLWENKLNRIKNFSKTFACFYSVFFLFTSFDFSLICDVTPAIIHVLHGLSGQIRSRDLCLDSHRTVSILWRLRSRPSSHLLRVQRQLKRGSVTNLTPESLQGIPFKKK